MLSMNLLSSVFEDWPCEGMTALDSGPGSSRIGEQDSWRCLASILFSPLIETGCFPVQNMCSEDLTNFQSAMENKGEGRRRCFQKARGLPTHLDALLGAKSCLQSPYANYWRFIVGPLRVVCLHFGDRFTKKTKNKM